MIATFEKMFAIETTLAPPLARGTGHDQAESIA
jgi:hypothetical protein